MARLNVPERRERPFDMRSLRRLATWGLSATAALLLAVVVGFSSTPSRKVAATPAALTPAQKGDAEMAASRLPEIDAQTRRLAETVRMLTTDRERLLARLDALEQTVNDLTGSIKAAAPAAAQPQSAAPAGPPAPQSAEAPPASEPNTPERMASAIPSIPEGVDPAKGELGVDVGGAGNFEGLRTLWSATKATNKMMFDGLRPQVVVRENSKTKAPELRLVVGPLPTVEAATRLCGALSTARRYCQPVAFEGQRLAVTDADTTPEQKSDRAEKSETKSEHRADHRSTSKPKPAAPSSTPSVLRFFR
jgi:hypothetical protein